MKYLIWRNNIITEDAFLSANVKKYNSAARHLRFSYISILTNLLRTDNETKNVKLYRAKSIKKDKKDNKYTQKKNKNAIKSNQKNSLRTSKTKEC